MGPAVLASPASWLEMPTLRLCSEPTMAAPAFYGISRGLGCTLMFVWCCTVTQGLEMEAQGPCRAWEWHSPVQMQTSKRCNFQREGRVISPARNLLHCTWTHLLPSNTQARKSRCFLWISLEEPLHGHRHTYIQMHITHKHTQTYIETHRYNTHTEI